MTDVAYHRPRSLDEVWRLCAEIPGARLIAGGTDLVPRLRDGRERPPAPDVVVVAGTRG